MSVLGRRRVSMSGESYAGADGLVEWRASWASIRSLSDSAILLHLLQGARAMARGRCRAGMHDAHHGTTSQNIDWKHVIGAAVSHRAPLDGLAIEQMTVRGLHSVYLQHTRDAKRQWRNQVDCHRSGASAARQVRAASPGRCLCSRCPPTT